MRRTSPGVQYRNFRKIHPALLLIQLLVWPIASLADGIAGNWCLNGEPYTCYPPIEHHGEAHACIESSAINNVSADGFDWVISQNMHYYTNGLANGGQKPMLLKYHFTRTQTGDEVEYRNIEQDREATQIRKIVLREEELDLYYKLVPHKTGVSKQNQLQTYKRCSSDNNEPGFYTALVDCGGTGDYIAGVPSVIDNALLWDLGDHSGSNKGCHVAAKCWGGGWVAVAYSDKETVDGKAFGAACGGNSRNAVIEQAIRSCQDSGGSNCFSTVVSGFDAGLSYNTNTDKKGNRVQRCNNGVCAKVK